MKSGLDVSQWRRNEVTYSAGLEVIEKSPSLYIPNLDVKKKNSEWKELNFTIIMQCVQCLKEATRYCELEKICSEEISFEDELIWLRLIERIIDISNNPQNPERLRTHNKHLESCVNYLQ